MNLQRRTPMKRTALNPGTKGLARTGIKRKTEMKRVSIEPGKSGVNPLRKPLKPGKPLSTKPAPKSPEERAGRKGVKKRALAEILIDGDLQYGRWCECCGKRPGSEWSHRVGKGQCGLWDISNGLWACATCHRWMHANPNAAKALGWHLHPNADPLLSEVVYRGRKALLDNVGGVLFALDFKEAA